MAYRMYIWDFADSAEYEIKHKGKYGAAGEKRAPKCRPTPEQVEKQNRLLRINRVRRLIKANFKPGDLWITLKYPKGARPGADSVKNEMKKFIARLRRAYKKNGEELRYIYRVELGKRGGVHIHMILNRSDARPDTDRLVQEQWRAGRINCASLYEQGGYESLAEYLVKELPSEMKGQLSLIPEEDRHTFRTYVPSRNLIKPRPECREYMRRTLRKLFEEGPKARKGYYIDKDSITYGVNPYTGMSYYRYTEVRIRSTREAADDG